MKRVNKGEILVLSQNKDPRLQCIEMSNSYRGQKRWQQQKVVKVVMVMMGICIAGYIVGPPLYWHLSENLAPAFRSSSCPPCICDCSYQPLLSLPDGLSNGTFTDCMKHDPEVSEEMEKSFSDLLSEEVKLREAEFEENQKHTDIRLLEAKKMASQYQKEADKCNAGMETCEKARNKAEATLEGQKIITAMWELRARQRGWKEGSIRSTAY